MRQARWFSVLLLAAAWASAVASSPPQEIHFTLSHGDFAIAAHGVATPIYVDPQAPETVRLAAQLFAEDVERVTGLKPKLLTSLDHPPSAVILVGVCGQSSVIDRLGNKLDTSSIRGRWESAVTSVVHQPMPGVQSALVIAGSDRRGAAFALLSLSRKMGVSPWLWWADVPAKHHNAVYIQQGAVIQQEPSVQYRGIFLNDEDWGLRPWASRKMDPERNNIGPHTYERVFELLLRLRANTLWPAMHPGTLAFNAIPENAALADRWGIVMGSSHSEALLRNNVGEWDEKRDGPWNYQLNHKAIDAYWDKRIVENGRYENFYTVGMRGVHDSGLQATGSLDVKARLVEEIMQAQRGILGKHLSTDLASIPQVIWLYKESLDLYRVGMRVPDDVTLGWTDDNFGYLRQLPTVAEQHRAGGSGIYYHLSYWGSPHDNLWLSSTAPALIREELAKGYDHGARRFWVANVGDLKPAEINIDFFMQLAWDEPQITKISQREYLKQWAAEQFPKSAAPAIAEILDGYYRLNFIRKPEFMGFNRSDPSDLPIHRAAFTPLAWGDQNRLRSLAWDRLRQKVHQVEKTLQPSERDAFFELVGYPVLAAAAQNDKFLSTDRSFLDASRGDLNQMAADSAKARSAYDEVQTLTAKFNRLAGGKWQGIMSASPVDVDVFKMPRTAVASDVATPLPAAWKAGSSAELASGGKGYTERNGTVSINASHFARKHDGSLTQWRVIDDLGVSGASLVYGSPGILANIPSQESPSDAPWVEYDFHTASADEATLTLYLLPTFPVDAQHHLRFAVALDGETPKELAATDSNEWHEKAAEIPGDILRNSTLKTLTLGHLKPGPHALRLIYREPGVVFEHLALTFPSAPPAYPTPPETFNNDRKGVQ